MMFAVFATRFRRTFIAAAVSAVAPWTLATTPLADQPVFSTISVPGNLALALSVEFPTAISVAHTAAYTSASTYLGYFDPNKCYLYSFSATEALRHFYPAGAASSRVCTGTDDAKWSGNFLNWATMQTIDPFRWALTGGYRSTDTATETILEKAFASNQGSDTNFPNRSLGTAALVSAATPLDWSALNMRVRTLGNKMRFTRTGTLTAAGPTDYDPAAAVSDATVYEVSVRVKVCDSSAGAGPLEANCKLYPAGNYKPTGLIQQYSDQIRYSAFGYLNDSALSRDGGVLRAQQKFVGPTRPVPGSGPVANAAAEWNESNGVMVLNPDAADAADTSTLFGVTVNNSGVMNYLNKFGQITPGTYKTFDPVGELYYAALRYFKKLGNVPEYTSMTGQSTATKTTWIDGFPVITNWNDPIQYSCQKNFILGIGDVNTHADRNLPGGTGSSEPSKPALVTADTTVNALAATNKVGALHGIGSIGATQGYGGCCNNNGALMAGLAYDANAKDIRPDDATQPQTKGRQTVQTYWLDILEFSTYKSNNQFYLAAKYGGFNVPETFDPYAISTDIPEAWWYTNTDTVGGQKRPDTYYTADRPDLVVAGLTKAFASIASKLKATTTSFSTSLPQISSTGTASFATQFDAKVWSGELVASKLAITAGAPTLTETWRFSAKLDAQGAGTGWDTGRVIASYNTDTGAGVPFRTANLSASQVLALDTAYRSGDDSADYLKYLRGDRTHEKASTASGSARAYRDRATLLGDIVNSKSLPVGRPSARYSSAANPGYSAFKSTYSGRKTMVYVGTNFGMLHAIDGTEDSTGGKEVFAYVPGALYAGPTSTPQTNGLQALGNPVFTHYNFVDATPVSADIDMGKTVGGSGTNWRTILVGGLGKGGRSLYALDITDPSTMTSETAVASKVLWEFRDADLGFTYGEPAIVKTKKYGWVVIFGSGHNNADGKGYFFIVNPRNGALLEKIETGAGSVADPAGMAHVRAFLVDLTDGTADAVYAGDLHGNLWRLDVTAGSGAYPAPLKLAQLTDSSDVRLPVTSRPLIIAQPNTNRRFVTVGTGRLLHSSDSGSSQAQRYFAIIDGSGARFNATAPTGFSFPITRSKLKQLTDLTQKVTFDLTKEIGWFVDLGQVAGGAGWRVISDSSSFNGVVAFSAMVPASDSACEPTGSSRVYAIDLGNGRSRLLNSSGGVIAYNDSLSGVVTDMGFFGDGKTNGEKYFVIGNDGGKLDKPNIDLGTTMRLRRLNWREVPLND